MGTAGQSVAAIPWSVSELHLSDNYISEKGFAGLLKCIALNPAYPKVEQDADKCYVTPIWCRINNNCRRGGSGRGDLGGER